MNIEKTKAKTISVVMCTYNGEKFIREQLDSIVSQTYPIHELIIQDDCSTDNTIKIIQEYASKYKYIKLYQNKQNIGFNQNFKTAILKATGDYIAISDQDDIWYKNKLKVQIGLIGNHSLCTSSYHRDVSYTKNNEKGMYPSCAIEFHVFYNSISGHSMLLEKQFAQSIFHNWDNHTIYDWWITINAHLNKGIICSNEQLLWHRPHTNSTIAKHMAKYNIPTNSKHTWKPYVYGYFSYRELQQLSTWKSFYTFIYQNTSTLKYPLTHTLSNLLLKRDLISLLKLCGLCLKHKNTIYYNPNQKGLMSYIRGFFYPFIKSYGNTDFYF